MKVSGKLTIEELMQVRRVLWTPHFWLNLVNHTFMRGGGLIVLMAVMVFAGAGMMTVRHPPYPCHALRRPDGVGRDRLDAQTPL